jgi:hypothetical protein
VVMRILPGDPLVAIFGPEGFTKLSDKERAGYMAELGAKTADLCRKHGISEATFYPVFPR